MQIQVGAEWQAPGGGYQSYAVTYEEQDILDAIEHGAGGRGKAITILSRRADALVLAYVYSRSGIPESTYRARLQEIRDGS